MSQNSILVPSFQMANANLPGNSLLWEALLNQSDIFAFETAQYRNTDFGFIPKGGPFGAQLWLYHPQGDLVLVGTEQRPEDSNAVVTKGLASAHAEAENLSMSNRVQVAEFLSRNKNGWKVVQISSGESCPACRSKQVIFANDLIAAGLIEKGDFHVAFKATYDQTRDIAGFNDAPYDNTFRSLDHLKRGGQISNFSDLGAAMSVDAQVSQLHRAGQLVHVPVYEGVLNEKAAASLDANFGIFGNKPAAAIVSPDGQEILSLESVNTSLDERAVFENNAIVGAIQSASRYMRAEKGKFMGAWDLERSVLVTNIAAADLGPLSIAEALWSNLSGVVSLVDRPALSELTRESSEYSNAQLFDMVAAPYNDEVSPIQVTYLGAGQESVAQHLWGVQQARLEPVLSAQAERLRVLDGVDFSYIDGKKNVPLSELVQHNPGGDAHYDGAQAGQVEEAPVFIDLAP